MQNLLNFDKTLPYLTALAPMDILMNEPMNTNLYCTPFFYCIQAKVFILLKENAISIIISFWVPPFCVNFLLPLLESVKGSIKNHWNGCVDLFFSVWY